jgi:hypothetical protein
MRRQTWPEEETQGVIARPHIAADYNDLGADEVFDTHTTFLNSSFLL